MASKTNVFLIYLIFFPTNSNILSDVKILIADISQPRRRFRAIITSVFEGTEEYNSSFVLT